MSPTSGVIGEAWDLYKAHWQHLLTFSLVVYVGVALVGAVLGLIFDTWLERQYHGDDEESLRPI